VHASKKVVGLPDKEFGKMLRRAVELWGEYLALGDRRFTLEPERQHGALHRNVAILLCMRYAHSDSTIETGHPQHCR
jgi:hypothetical protein